MEAENQKRRRKKMPWSTSPESTRVRKVMATQMTNTRGRWAIQRSEVSAYGVETPGNEIWFSRGTT